MSSAAATNAAGGSPRLHLNHVDGLRALASLAVFVNHAYGEAIYTDAPAARAVVEHPPFVLFIFSFFMIFGHLAVSVFIVISGFCLTLPVIDSGDALRGGAWQFFKRRMRRILPPYYGALLLSLGLIFTIIGNRTGTIWDVPIVVDWRAIVAHLVLLQDLFRTGRINYVFWSIAVEWHIYFLFPLLVWGTRRFGIVKLAILALCVGYAIRFGVDSDRVQRANPQYVGLFALGMLAAYIVRSSDARFRLLRVHPAWAWAAPALLALVVALTWGMGIQVAHEKLHYLDIPVGLMAMAILVHSTSSPDGRLARFLTFGPLVFVGTFSYSVYLVHAPLLQVVWQYALAPLNLSPPQVFACLMTGGFAVVLGCSYLFFRVCEEPFMTSVRTPILPVPDATSAPTA